jgi:phospholipid/cholesterol/gamma-HCH transport system permease protein
MSPAAESSLSFARRGDRALEVRLGGAWRLRSGLPSAALLQRELEAAPQVRSVAFEARELISWDSSVLAFLVDISELCRKRGITMDRDSLPAGLRRLLDLAEAVPEKAGARRQAVQTPFLERIGNTTIGAGASLGEMLAFLGDMTLTFGRLLRMKVRFRAVDLMLLIQQSGAQALPIVTLISFLVGVILAFVGAVQLKQFGAQIYVADLVGIAMVREMGAMMTGIIMAGRTGAAFAAQLGTMKVTQEIDAFTTMGFSALEFLVLPRVIALVLMMPLLCLYADLVGVLGGAAIGVGMLDLSWTTYLRETSHAIGLGDVFGGVFKASVYGVLIALSGCLRGIQCGNSSSAVGDAATSAVVTGIVAIVIACGLFAVVFYVLGI